MWLSELDATNKCAMWAPQKGMETTCKCKLIDALLTFWTWHSIGFRCHGCDSDECPVVAVTKFFKWLVALKLYNLSKSSVSVDNCDDILLVDKRWCTLLPIFLQNFGIVNLGDMWKMHKETKKWHDDSKDKDDSTVHFYQTTSCCNPNCKVHESSTSSSSFWDISVFLDTSKRPSDSNWAPLCCSFQSQTLFLMRCKT